MTNAEIIHAIRNEIKRKIKAKADSIPTDGDMSIDDYATIGGMASLQYFLSFLDSLEKEDKYRLDMEQEWENPKEDVQTRFAFYTYKDEPEVVYLSNVFVREESRGKRYGNAILDIVDKVAKGMGATAVCLTVKRGSFAHRWYERHGYEYLSDNDDEEFVDHIWMKKQL